MMRNNEEVKSNMFSAIERGADPMDLDTFIKSS